MTKLEDFLRPTQKQLFKRLCKHFRGNALISKGDFVLVKGISPIMLVAHMDTVHEQPVRDICTYDDDNILMSPQGIGGDDRCGCYALVKVYRAAQVKPWLLFTTDEEVGGLGAQTFCDYYYQGYLPDELCELKCLVEIDRRGSNDAVFYDCDNPDFEAYINGKGFKTAHGSFTDISLIAPTLGVAAVNLSSGYYNAHRLNEYIVRSELEHTIRRIIDIVADANNPEFPRFLYTTTHFDKDYLYGYYDDDINFPADLPVEYHEVYEELRYVYTAAQLEEIRIQYGNQILNELYREEFGYQTYFDR